MIRLNKRNLKVTLILINILALSMLSLDLMPVMSQGRDTVAENFSVVKNFSRTF